MGQFSSAEFEINNREIMPEREPSLEPTKNGLKDLGLTDSIDPEKVIVVAGTNGKGSVSKTIETLLRAAGKTTGLYTSPHLISICERIQINGNNLSEEVFAEVFFSLKEKTDITKLSHFEILTLMASLSFHSDGGPEYTIYEVGMGGTWDATNAIPHCTSVITKIGKDHEHLLGSELTSIAKNKFGIVQNGNRVIHLPFVEELKSLVDKTRLQTNSKWTEAEILNGHQEKNDFQTYIEFKGERYPISLSGERGIENVSLAICAVQAMGINVQGVLKSLSDIKWPGRMQKIDSPISKAPIYLSGDHNEQGLESLLKIIEGANYEKIHFLVSVGQKKNHDLILPMIESVPRSSLYLTTASFMGRSKEQYGHWGEQCQYYPSPIEALNEVGRLAQSNDIIVVTGSLYLVGDLLSEIQSL